MRTKLNLVKNQKKQNTIVNEPGQKVHLVLQEDTEDTLAPNHDLQNIVKVVQKVQLLQINDTENIEVHPDRKVTHRKDTVLKVIHQQTKDIVPEKEYLHHDPKVDHQNVTAKVELKVFHLQEKTTKPTKIQGVFPIHQIIEIIKT